MWVLVLLLSSGRHRRRRCRRCPCGFYCCPPAPSCSNCGSRSLGVPTDRSMPSARGGEASGGGHRRSKRRHGHGEPPARDAREESGPRRSRSPRRESRRSGRGGGPAASSTGELPSLGRVHSQRCREDRGFLQVISTPDFDTSPQQTRRTLEKLSHGGIMFGRTTSGAAGLFDDAEASCLHTAADAGVIWAAPTT